MNIFKDLKRQWDAETPLIAKRIRDIAAILTAVIPTAWGTFKLMEISLPEWFNNCVGYITFASLLIVGIAGTKEKKK